MKSIERGSVKHLAILIIAIAIFGMVLFPIFDLLYCKFISNSDFIYTVHNYIVKPILFAFISGIVIWVVDKKKKD